MNEETGQQSKDDSKCKVFFRKLRQNAMTTTNGMAIGLFGTLIIGTILDLFAQIPGFSAMSSFTSVIKGLMGAGIGLGVALSLKLDGVKVVSCMAAGAIGNYAFSFSTMKVSSIGDLSLVIFLPSSALLPSNTSCGRRLPWISS